MRLRQPGELERPQRRVLRRSLRMGLRVVRLVVKEAKLAVQEAQDDQLEQQAADVAATSGRCSAGCPQRRSPICKRVMP